MPPVPAAPDAHGQDDIRVLAALEQVAEHVIGDAPDGLYFWVSATQGGAAL